MTGGCCRAKYPTPCRASPARRHRPCRCVPATADRRRHGRSRTTRHVYVDRSEEHTSELQSLMRISYAVFCLKKKKNTQTEKENTSHIPRYENNTPNFT